MAIAQPRKGNEFTTSVLNKPRSRYVRGGDTLQRGNKAGWWERKILPTNYDDITVEITPKYNKRPDLVAFDFLGNPNLQWLVLQYNSIVDINTEFVTGQTITLPTRSRAELSF